MSAKKSDVSFQQLKLFPTDDAAFDSGKIVMSCQPWLHTKTILESKLLLCKSNIIYKTAMNNEMKMLVKSVKRTAVEFWNSISFVKL